MLNKLVVIGVLLCAACAGAPQKSESLPFIGEFKVHRYVLGNGLKLMVVEDDSSPTFAYHTWFRVGSRDEKVKYTGLAHLFEHMMFKGTTTHPPGEFDRLLERAGAEGENAFTSHDYTAYVQEMPKSQLDLIIELESDRMVNLVVDQKAFKTETEVVQNERRFRTENSPDGTIVQTLFETAYTKHSYRWPVIGYQEDLERMSAQDALDFYKTYYSPNNAIIVVVGDVDADEVYSKVQKHYSAFARQSLPTPQIETEPPQQTMRRKRLPLNIQVEKLYMGYHVPAEHHPDAPVLELIQGVLTNGNSGRLRKSMLDTGIVSSIDSGSYQNKDPSVFIFSANMQKGKTVSLAESVINREIERLSKDLVPEAELVRVKNLIDFHFYNRLTSNYEKASFIGRFEATLGSYEAGMKFMQDVRNVSAEDIRRVARTYFTPNNKTVITGVPK